MMENQTIDSDTSLKGTLLSVAKNPQKL